MKPPPFTYHAPESVTDALRLLAEHGHGAKVLAGGQSLIPLLNMRLAAPEHVVDVNRLPGLDSIAADPDGVRVGALVRHADLERHAGAARAQPLLGRALRLVAHPVIRNRGTVVGSLAHADPAAELPAVLALLGGTVELASASGNRTVAAAEFFAGPLETTARADELAVGAHFPAASGRSGCAFEEVAQRHGDFALAGVAVTVRLDDDLRVVSARAAYVGVGSPPPVLDLTDVVGGRWDSAPPSWYSQDAKPEGPFGGGVKPEGPSGRNAKPEGPFGGGAKPENPSGGDATPESPSGAGATPDRLSGAGATLEGLSGAGATPESPSAGGSGQEGRRGWPELRAYVAERIEPDADIHASAEYRRHLAGVLTERALRAAYADAMGER